MERETFCNSILVKFLEKRITCDEIGTKMDGMKQCWMVKNPFGIDFRKCTVNVMFDDLEIDHNVCLSESESLLNDLASCMDHKK
jgi:hypothetical protein